MSFVIFYYISPYIISAQSRSKPQEEIKVEIEIKTPPSSPDKKEPQIIKYKHAEISQWSKGPRKEEPKERSNPLEISQEPYPDWTPSKTE